MFLFFKKNLNTKFVLTTKHLLLFTSTTNFNFFYDGNNYGKILLGRQTIIIYGANYLLFMGQIIYYLWGRLFIIYGANYLLFMGQIIYYLWDRLLQVFTQVLTDLFWQRQTIFGTVTCFMKIFFARVFRFYPPQLQTDCPATAPGPNIGDELKK